MDKVSVWLFGFAVVLNLVLAVVLLVLLTSDPFRDDTQQRTASLLSQLSSELQDGRKTLSPSEQTRLVNDFRFVAKARADAQAAGTKMLWSIIEVIAIALVLQFIVLFRVWRNRSAVTSRSQPTA